MSDMRANDPVPTFQARDFLGYEPQGNNTRRFDFAEVARTTLRLLSENWPGIVLITFVFSFLPEATQTLIGNFVDLDRSVIWSSAGVGDEKWGWLDIVTILFTFLSSGYLTLLVLSKEVKNASDFRRYLAMTGPILGICALTLIGALVGFSLLVVPGIVLYGMLSVSLPVLICEGKGFAGSMGGSRELTRGSRWQIFWLILGYIVFSILTFRSAEFLGEIVTGLSSLPYSTEFLTLIMNIVVGAISTITFAALYLHLRFLKEGPQIAQVATVFE